MNERIYIEGVVKVIPVNTESGNCTALTLIRDIEGECNEGIRFIAWHHFEEVDYIQEQFVMIPANQIRSFLNDYSTTSAQDFVDEFQP